MPQDILQGLQHVSSVVASLLPEKKREVEKAKVNYTLGKVGEIFSSLDSKASESDVSQAMFNSIKEATLIGNSAEAIPLIEGLYNNKINALKKVEEEAAEQAFIKEIAPIYGADPNAPWSKETLQAYTAERRAGLERLEFTDEEDRAFYTIYELGTNEKGHPTYQMRQAMPKSMLSWYDKEKYKADLQSKSTKSALKYLGMTETGYPAYYNDYDTFIDVGENLVKWRLPQFGRIRGAESDLVEQKRQFEMKKTASEISKKNASGIAKNILNELKIGAKDFKISNYYVDQIRQEVFQGNETEFLANLLGETEGGRLFGEESPLKEIMEKFQEEGKDVKYLTEMLHGFVEQYEQAFDFEREIGVRSYNPIRRKNTTAQDEAYIKEAYESITAYNGMGSAFSGKNKPIWRKKDSEKTQQDRETEAIASLYQKVLMKLFGDTNPGRLLSDPRSAEKFAEYIRQYISR